MKYKLQEAVEEWKDIKGYEGFYQVSNKGKVMGVKRNKIKIPSINEWGYECVSLSKPNSKIKTCFVHRLVAQAFITNPENKPEVNHIDGNKKNNIISNLEWNTRSENNDHAFKNHLIENHSGEHHNASKITSEMLDMAIKLRKEGHTYLSLSSIINTMYGTNISRVTFNAALLGNTWSNQVSEDFRVHKSRLSNGTLRGLKKQIEQLQKSVEELSRYLEDAAKTLEEKDYVITPSLYRDVIEKHKPKN